MSICGIGRRNTYIYNSQTKKLATKDGLKKEEGKSVGGAKRSFSDVATMKAEAVGSSEVQKRPRPFLIRLVLMLRMK